MAGAEFVNFRCAALGLIVSLLTACAHDFSHGRVVMCGFDEYFFVKESDAVAVSESGTLTVHASYGKRLIGRLGVPEFHRFRFATDSSTFHFGRQPPQSTGLTSIDGAILYRVDDLPAPKKHAGYVFRKNFILVPDESNRECALSLVLNDDASDEEAALAVAVLRGTRHYRDAQGFCEAQRPSDSRARENFSCRSPAEMPASGY
jgi:hypothetical protein